MQPECNDIAITGKDTYNNYNQGPPISIHSSKNNLPLPPCIVCNVVKNTMISGVTNSRYIIGGGANFVALFHFSSRISRFASGLSEEH